MIRFGITRPALVQRIGARPNIATQARENTCLRLVLCLAWAAALSGCAARDARVNGRPETTAANPGYIDLERGWRLCVVTPLLKSGEFRLRTPSAQADDHTLTASAGQDFLGYETAYYSVSAQSGGGVQIEFTSAGVTRNGKTEPQLRSLVPLFRLPPDAKYIRLIYLMRASEADHDMALVAANQTEALDALTRRVQASPSEACTIAPPTYCSWIPAGVAVRPEMQILKRAVMTWVPAR